MPVSVCHNLIWTGTSCTGKFYVFDTGSSPPLNTTLSSFVAEGSVEYIFYEADFGSRVNSTSRSTLALLMVHTIYSAVRHGTHVTTPTRTYAHTYGTGAEEGVLIWTSSFMPFPIVFQVLHGEGLTHAHAHAAGMPAVDSIKPLPHSTHAYPWPFFVDQPTHCLPPRCGVHLCHVATTVLASQEHCTWLSQYLGCM